MSLAGIVKRQLSTFALFFGWLSGGAAVSGADLDIPPGGEGFRSRVRPFLETHCIGCHGPEKSKGKVTLHTLDGELSGGMEMKRWELILEMLESGEMPPEDEPQPKSAERNGVARWIDAGLRAAFTKASQGAEEPTTRRLTRKLDGERSSA